MRGDRDGGRSEQACHRAFDGMIPVFPVYPKGFEDCHQPVEGVREQFMGFKHVFTPFL